jgi:uncharacterized protein
MMRHWNIIASALHKGQVYVPLLLENADGMAHGNDWARGFMRGMGMRHDGWAQLVNDEEHGGCLIPTMMLYHEHDEDPEMRPKPIGPEQREEVIVHMAAGLVAAYRYFREHGRAHIGTTFTPEPRRNAPKVGRNDLCPCGSGKKYKRCCGGGDRKLTLTPNSSNGSAPTPECDTRGGARFGMKRRLGYKGYVIEAPRTS